MSTKSLVFASLIALAGTAMAQAPVTRAEVKAQAIANPPAAGQANTKSEVPAVASSTTRQEVRAEARKSKPAAGQLTDVGTTPKSKETRAQVRAQTRAAVKAGQGPASGQQ